MSWNMRIDISELSVNYANVESSVRYTVYGSWTDGTTSVRNRNINITITENGTRHVISGSAMLNPSGTQSGEAILYQTTRVVGRNNSGDGNVSISATYSVDGQASLTRSGSLSLTTIYPVCSISSVTGLQIGEPISVMWVSASSSQKFTLKYAIGNWEYTTDYIECVSPLINAITYDEYSLPIDDIMPMCPNGESLQMTVTLYTYQHNTPIGSPQSTVVTVTPPGASSVTSADGGVLGRICNVVWTPNSAYQRFKIKFSAGTWNVTTDYISPNTTNQYTYSQFVLPIGDLRAVFPNAESINVNVELYSYYNTTQVGTASSTVCVVRAPYDSSVKINFDNNRCVSEPTFVLATRTGEKLGPINAVDVSISDNLNSAYNLEFKVYQYDNGVECTFWDNITDFMLIWCREWNVWFEISVTYQEDDSPVKIVSGTSLGESELSQIYLYNIEINTEDDIARDDYDAENPTVLYNPSRPDASLLHRIMEKAPHYCVEYVDTSIQGISRVFSFDNTSIYDAFQEIAEEIHCIFIINSGSRPDGSIARSIRVYDLESYCLNCGYREDFDGDCPKCGNSNVIHGYGEDTTIFVSVENLAEEIKYSTNTGDVKNCFRLEGGDDLMTATIMSCNPNGSQYIWYISDEVRNDMPDALSDKLDDYDADYEYYMNEYEMPFTTDSVLTRYNALVTKYPAKTSLGYSRWSSKQSPIVGYSSLMESYYDATDMKIYLESEMMPSVETAVTNAAIQAELLRTTMPLSVGVQNYDIISVATASNFVLNVAKYIVHPNFQVKVDDQNLTISGSTKVWSGTFRITNYSDDEDTATTATISTTITPDYETFTRQRIDKILSEKDEKADGVDVVSLFDLSHNWGGTYVYPADMQDQRILDSGEDPSSDFALKLREYCLSSLKTFYDCGQACIDILISMGVSDPKSLGVANITLYDDIYLPYYHKMRALANEIIVRESEIATLDALYDEDKTIKTHGMLSLVEQYRKSIQSELNFEAYLGTELWTQFCMYRREDTYSNQNYCSDGLSNAMLFERAKEFLEKARQELFKSATLQHTITASLHNLLAMKEFEPIINYFCVGNWIRIRIDGVVYKLRLMSYEMDFNNPESLTVEFSDVQKSYSGLTDIQSVLDSASSMASSYDTISRQAGKGKSSNDRLNHWVEDGLYLTNMNIIDNADSQNMLINDHGLLCREYVTELSQYDDKQVKLINKGLYFTNDNWETAKAGIGQFNFWNPATGQMSESYGVIADTIVGDVILGKEVGVYNEYKTISMNQDGIGIVADCTGDSSRPQTTFSIQRKTLDDDDNDVFESLLYIDADGNLVLNGSVMINTNDDSERLDILLDSNRMQQMIDETLSRAIYSDDADTCIIGTFIDERYNGLKDYTDNILSGKFNELNQYLTYDDSGLRLGSSDSAFSTLLNNNGMYFQENTLSGNQTVAYITNQQLYINNATILQRFMLGNYFFNVNSDGSVSIVWQED